MMIDDKMDEATCADMVSGRPLPLLSNYKLTYYTLLNLLRKQDGTSEQKKTIERSFHQYQHQSSVPAMQKEIEALNKEDGGTLPLELEQHFAFEQLNERYYKDWAAWRKAYPNLSERVRKYNLVQ